jgi:hypothetical protein
VRQPRHAAPGRGGGSGVRGAGWHLNAARPLMKMIGDAGAVCRGERLRIPATPCDKRVRPSKPRSWVRSPRGSLLVERYEHPFRRCKGRGTPYAHGLDVAWR